MRLRHATCALVHLAVLPWLTAQPAPTVDGPRRKVEFRPHLLATVHEWLTRQPPAPTDLEIDGTICSLLDIRARARTMLSREETPRSLALAMADDVISGVLEQELRRTGHWVSDPEFDAAFAEHRAPYDGTPFPLAVIAVNFNGFPSLEAYRRRFRLLSAYEASIAAQLDLESLRAHARAGLALSERKVAVSLLRFALDGKGGEASAAARAQEARDAWVGGAEFRDLAARADPLAPNTARWAPNQLRQALRENDYTDLLAHLVSREIFGPANPAEVVGPLRGVDAYWVVRVEERDPAPPLPYMADEGVRRLVRQDCVLHRFHAWAAAVLDRATLRVHVR